MTIVEEKHITQKTEERKPYVPPKIVHELELETRAGSPLSPIHNPFDPTRGQR
jgi:hypothetical protein